jgi:hypothetical protein
MPAQRPFAGMSYVAQLPDAGIPAIRQPAQHPKSNGVGYDIQPSAYIATVFSTHHLPTSRPKGILAVLSTLTFSDIGPRVEVNISGFTLRSRGNAIPSTMRRPGVPDCRFSSKSPQNRCPRSLLEPGSAFPFAGI